MLAAPAVVEFPECHRPLFTPRRYKVLYGGRGGMKSWDIARALLIIGRKRNIRVLCARELQNSIEESVHKLLYDQIDILGFSGFYTIEKSKIYGPGSLGDRTEFFFDGIRNNINKIKSYEGIDYCWVEEANKVSRNSWNVLIPTIRKPGSEIWLSFNPELKKDETYQRFVVNPPRDAIVIKTTFRDNPWLTTELRNEMIECKARDEDEYLNIWEGFPIQHLSGAIYAKELRRVRLEGRLCQVPCAPGIGVETFWDLGRADKTCIWFVQRVGMQWRILDYYERSDIAVKQEDGGLTTILRDVQRKPYLYDRHWLPHDAKHKRLGYRNSIEDIVRKALKDVSIAPNLSVADGINMTRMVFPNCYFDLERCSDGFEKLGLYRFGVDKDGQLSDKPLHDDSDPADAFRYFGVCSREAPRRKDGETTASRFKRNVSQWVEKAPGFGWMQ